MKKIILYKGTNCIVASYLDENGNPDETMIEIFGTHELPTAFTEKADLYHVSEVIKSKNPEYSIEIR